ncbi:MAG: GNAT family N-acetyltransferase [Oscillospiraceae bacterium]|nr:GNAT family N-acetyltransferase [Oscillospiraceae bacterium]
MDHNIRTAVPADEKRIRELFTEMLRTIYGTDDVKGYEDGCLDRFLSGGEDRIYVADDGEVTAFLSVEVHREEKEYIYLDDLSVTEAHRNKGTGTALISTAEGYARSLGIYAVLLHAEKTNVSAIRLYERLGYSVYRDDGNRYLMKKDIK